MKKKKKRSECVNSFGDLNETKYKSFKIKIRFKHETKICENLKEPVVMIADLMAAGLHLG